jgi:hypothetical protein
LGIGKLFKLAAHFALILVQRNKTKATTVPPESPPANRPQLTLSHIFAATNLSPMGAPGGSTSLPNWHPEERPKSHQERKIGKIAQQ